MLRLFRGWTLQRYVLREFAVIFLLALVAVTLLMSLAVLYLRSSELNLPLARIAPLLPFQLPTPLQYSVPLAALIATTMVFSRLSAEDEVLAAQAGGAPLRVLALPIILCGVLLSLYCLWNNQWGIAWSNSFIRNQIFKLNDPEKFYNILNQPGASLSRPLENGSIAHINLLPLPQDGSSRRPIHMAFFQNQQVALTVVAQDFTYKINKRPTEIVLSLTLKGAQRLGESPAYFDELVVEIPNPPLDLPIGQSRGQKGWLENYNDSNKVTETIHKRQRFLLARVADFAGSAIASGATDPAGPIFTANGWHDARLTAGAIYANGGVIDRAHSDAVEFWRKIALSLTPIAMVMLGIGLGLLVKKSQRMIGFLISLLVFALVFYPLMIVGKELAIAHKAGMIVLWLPNIVTFVLGYVLYFAYERGSLTGGLPPLVSTTKDDLVYLVAAIWRPVSALRSTGHWLFQRKTDGYIAGAFIVPLIVVMVTLSSIFTALDLAEHSGEVIQGIMLSNEPNPGVPPRSRVQAVVDACKYYGIFSLGWVCEFLPVIVLVAGLVCVFVLIRNNEHLILKSAGLPLQRAFRPIVILALLFSGGVTLVRQTIMPSLLMEKDALKPMVFHRSPAPNAIALYTIDAENKPVVFEMSEYTSATRSGKDLRIFLLDPTGKPAPNIVADIATWDGRGWKLQTDPNKVLEHPGVKKKKSMETLPLKNYGYLITPDPDAGSAADAPTHQLTSPKQKMETWSGTVTPALLESERLGTGVMRLGELAAASKVKKEFAVEWWRRISEVLMSVVLLWMAVPMLLSEESSGPLAGIGWSILIGALYWGLNLTFVNAAGSQMLPVWAPVIPHLAFLVTGMQRFYIRMQT
jgi:lipopolysaccharide export LptBFGC system permease protein LptF